MECWLFCYLLPICFIKIKCITFRCNIEQRNIFAFSCLSINTNLIWKVTVDTDYIKTINNPKSECKYNSGEQMIKWIKKKNSDVRFMDSSQNIFSSFAFYCKIFSYYLYIHRRNCPDAIWNILPAFILVFT